jgi:hypothetical protein
MTTLRSMTDLVIVKLPAAAPSPWRATAARRRTPVG